MTTFVFYEKKKTRGLLITNFTLESNIKFWSAIFLGYMIIQVILVRCRDIGLFGAIQRSNEHLFFVTSKVNFCGFGTTILTSNFLFAIEEDL